MIAFVTIGTGYLPSRCCFGHVAKALLAWDSKFDETQRQCAMDIHEMKDVHRIFVFVDTEMGQDLETMKRILSLEQVKDVHLVSG